MRILFFLCSVLSLSHPFFSPPLLTEEICHNGIDDDGDGFIDCLDGDCIYSENCAPCADDIPTPATFQTGYDESAMALLPVGTADSSWTWSETLMGVENLAIAGRCTCDPAGAWACSPVSGADWIASTADCLTGGLVYYHHRFSLDASLASTFALDLVLYSDDFVENIYLNDSALNITTSPPNYLPVTGQPFSISGGFSPDSNKLTIAVRNTGGPGGLLLTADPDSDFDEDGVDDALDRCLLSPNGFPVDKEGCTYFLTELDTLICNGNPIIWHGLRIDSVGQYADTLFASTGCDSIIQLEVKAASDLSFFIDSTICQDELVFIGGNTYSQSGSYIDTVFMPQGCDSIFHLDLTVLPFFDINIDTSIVVCEGVSVAGVDIRGDTVIVERLLAQTGCDSTVRYQITAIEKPITNFETAAPFCMGDSIPLSASFLPAATYSWSTGANGPEIAVKTAGLYVLQTRVQFCSWIDSVQVPEPISLALDLDYSPFICAQTQAGFIDFLNLPQGIEPLLWTVNGQAYDSLSRLDGLTGGQYDIRVSDAIGCSSDKQLRIDTLPRLQVRMESDIRIPMGESYSLTLESNRLPEEIITISWNPDSFVTCQHCLNPILLQPKRSLQYQIQIADTFGCQANLELSLQLIRQDHVFIPTAFSPNADGINDVFRVSIGPEVKRVQQVQIFNRWGSLVYEENSFPMTQEVNWDGQTFAGNRASEGVYIVLLRYEYLDGLVRNLSSSLTLIR